MIPEKDLLLLNEWLERNYPDHVVTSIDRAETIYDIRFTVKGKPALRTVEIFEGQVNIIRNVV